MNCEPSGVLANFILQIKDIPLKLVPWNIVVLQLWGRRLWIVFLTLVSPHLLRLWFIIDQRRHVCLQFLLILLQHRRLFLHLSKLLILAPNIITLLHRRCIIHDLRIWVR